MDAADRAAWRAARMALGERVRSDWNEARVALLTRRWAQGASASMIARELGGLSRSAVLGKVHRLKLKQPATKLRRARNGGPPRRRYRARRDARSDGQALWEAFRALGLALPIGTVEPSLDHASAGKAFGTPCGLLALSARTCRWPVGDPGEPGFAFCGAAPFKRYPYCIGHCLIAYRADDAPSVTGDGTSPAKAAARPNIARVITRAA